MNFEQIKLLVRDWKLERLLSYISCMGTIFKHRSSRKWLFGNSLRRKRSNFLLCSCVMTTFPPLKAIEPFRSRAEKLFRRINSFALIRTLALCQQSHRIPIAARGGFINYSPSNPPLIIPLGYMKHHRRYGTISESSITSC